MSGWLIALNAVVVALVPLAWLLYRAGRRAEPGDEGSDDDESSEHPDRAAEPLASPGLLQGVRVTVDSSIDADELLSAIDEALAAAGLAGDGDGVEIALADPPPPGGSTCIAMDAPPDRGADAVEAALRTLGELGYRIDIVLGTEVMLGSDEARVARVRIGERTSP